MSHPILALHALTEAIEELDMIQTWIDEARRVTPTNTVVQDKLDQQEHEINQKRFQIEYTMSDIRTRN